MVNNILRTQKGFTLIEIISVLMILGVLAVIAIPKYMSYEVEAQRKAVQYAVSVGIANLNLAVANCIAKGKEISDIAPDGTLVVTGGAGSCKPAETNLSDFTVQYGGTLPVITVTVISGPKWFNRTAMGTEAFGGQKSVDFRK